MKAIRKRELESTTDVLEIAPIFHSQSKYIGGREKKNFGGGWMWIPNSKSKDWVGNIK